jgi:hypothetical protein
MAIEIAGRLFEKQSKKIKRLISETAKSRKSLVRLKNISYENHTIDFPAQNGREPGFSRSRRNRISKKIKRAERSITKKWSWREEGKRCQGARLRPDESIAHVLETRQRKHRLSQQ